MRGLLMAGLMIGSAALAEEKAALTVEILDPEGAELIAAEPEMQELGKGYGWSEGPLWDAKNKRLLFTDVPNNIAYQWTEKDGVTEWMNPSGYTGEPRKGGVGANGLAFSAQGDLLICEHGDRRISRVVSEKDGKVTKQPFVSGLDGKRFHSPNDLAVSKAGIVFFTDPPYGLPKKDNDPGREIDFNGVFRVATDGNVTTIAKELFRPNGITLSPDEKFLYVAQSDPKDAKVVRYALKADGTTGDQELVMNLTDFTKEARGLPDGLKFDEKGHLWTTGPGGIFVIDVDEKKLLARVKVDRPVANLAWGEDGQSLFLTAHNRLLKVRTKVKGHL